MQFNLIYQNQVEFWSQLEILCNDTHFFRQKKHAFLLKLAILANFKLFIPFGVVKIIKQIIMSFKSIYNKINRIYG